MGDIVTNHKAPRDYFILETIEAGIALRGTEVKSLRAGKGQIADAFARVENGQAFLYNAHIDEYGWGNRNNHAPKGVRRLLMHRREILRLQSVMAQQGHALIPLSFYWKNGKVKVALGVGRSKAQFDKREDLKRREADREMKRAVLHRHGGRSGE